MRLCAAFTAISIALAVACGGGGGGDKPAPAEHAAAICAATPEVLGTVQAPEIVEASGIAASRQNDGVLWVHNDSGDTARVFAIDRAGKLLGTYTLAGAEAVDWEDMAIGPGPEQGVDYLYLADIGDNASQRSEIAVYRVKEPKVSKGDAPVTKQLDGVERLRLQYPDGPHDAETLLIDSVNNDVLIVTKKLGSNVSQVFRLLPQINGNIEGDALRVLPRAAGDGAFMLEQIATIDFNPLAAKVTPQPNASALATGAPVLATGGDISRDGSLIAIRTYGGVWVSQRPGSTSMADVFATQPCEAPSAVEPQGEAIAFDPDGNGYVTVSEGESPALNHFAAK